MKKRNLIIGSILAGSIGVAGLAQACGGPGGGFRGGSYEGHGGDRMMHVMKKLDLSQEQRESIRTINRDTRDQMESKRDEMFDIRQALQKQVSADNYDAARVRELADAKAKIMADITVQRIETMQKIRKQLTPEQLEEFDEMKERRSNRGGF